MPLTIGCPRSVFQPFQRFLDRLGLAGEVDDETFVTNDGALARQDGRGHEPQADLPHLFAEARHLLVADRNRGFGGDVARAGPVPPVVNTSAHPASTSSISVALMRACSSGIRRCSNRIGFFTARVSQSCRAGNPLSS
jgi:hypothetical protein